ncbi:MAG: tRNA pseudouridine(38-40) synthase TruA [Bacteroidota bacterium]
MNKYAIDLAYKGTHFHGWQRQPNALSVQQELEEKLALILRNPVETIGCGRTDTGVHAKQFVAHFESDQLIDTPIILHKINQVISKDIAIYAITLVDSNFNARFDAKYREYEYVINTKPNPFMNDLAWVFMRELDITLMNEACQILLAHKDFECFSKVHTQVNNFRCDLMLAFWESKEDGRLVFTIRANRFLRNMVRAIVGTLIEIGLHQTTLKELEEILASKNRSEAGTSVPAKGLYLTKVVY